MDERITIGVTTSLFMTLLILLSGLKSCVYWIWSPFIVWFKNRYIYPSKVVDTILVLLILSCFSKAKSEPARQDSALTFGCPKNSDVLIPPSKKSLPLS